jgi:hypothetical protein
MKLIRILIILFPNAVMAANPIKTIDLEHALKDKIIDVEFTYTYGPFHKSITTNLFNKSTESICLDVLPGTLLVSEKESYQNHLITKHDTIYLKPNIARCVLLSGMCCEPRDGCPSIGSKFYFTQNHRLELITLCQMIDSMQLNGYEAQTAIWSLADKRSPNDVIGEDSVMVMTLRNFVGIKLKKDVLPYKKSYYVKHVIALPTVMFNQSGIYDMDSLSFDDKISLELYDADTDLKIGAIKNERTYVQRSSLNLMLHNIQLLNLVSNTKYIIRLKKNGVVSKEWMYITG